MRKTGLVVALLASPCVLAQTPSTTNAPAAAAAVGSANTAANPTRQISLSEAVTMALQSNLDIQVFRFNPQFAEFALSRAYAVYEPNLNF